MHVRNSKNSTSHAVLKIRIIQKLAFIFSQIHTRLIFQIHGGGFLIKYILGTIPLKSPCITRINIPVWDPILVL